jgi:hypothetical protein
MLNMRFFQRVAMVILGAFIIWRLASISGSWDLPVVEILPPKQQAVAIPCITDLSLPVYTSDIEKARERINSSGILKGDFSQIFRHVSGDQTLPWHEIYDVSIASKRLALGPILLNPHLLVAPHLVNTSRGSGEDNNSLLYCANVAFRANENSALATCVASPILAGGIYGNQSGEGSSVSQQGIEMNLISFNAFAANFRAIAVVGNESTGVEILSPKDRPMAILPVVGEGAFSDPVVAGASVARLALLAESPGIRVRVVSLPAAIRLHLWKGADTTAANQMPDFVFDVAILSMGM